MSGRLRYVLALAFVALFVLFPAADQQRVAFLETKAWLTQQLDEVFAPEDRDQPPLPRLEVSYRAVGSSVAERAAVAEEFGRGAREWARGKGRSIDASVPPLRLSVTVGDNGFEAGLEQGPGEDSTLAQARTLRFLRDAVPGVEGTPGTYYPDRWSLLPAFLAIILAIVTGKVIPALLLGCLAGSMRYVGVLHSAGHFLHETVWREVLVDQFHIEILGFVFFLFMAIGVMTRSGGIRGMVEIVSKFARGPMSAQLASWVIGILIFFDDYSNCIITGTTMRPLTDRCGVSREKLAYIVDSTAAPIAGVSIFSTWVAYEVSMFAPQLPEVTRPDGSAYTQADGFAVFVETLPLRFYCIFTLVMVFLTIVLRREFGPMRRAEVRARSLGRHVADDARPLVSESMNKTEPPSDVPHLARNAFLPILVLVTVTVALIFVFGYSALSDPQAQRSPLELVAAILGKGESQRALCIAAAAAFVLALALAVGQRILTAGDALMSALRSAKSLVFAIVILVLAWSIGEICDDLGTSRFLTAAFHGSFEPWLLPSIMFMLSALVAFSTGTSYGTMSILLPNVVVLAHTMGQTDPNLGGTALMLLTIGAVLEGSIFGDHCSPISDTTVLSSVATGSDHMHHVRTQAPYAMAVMVIALACGYITTALLGPSAWPWAWTAGGGAILAMLLVLGRRVEPGVTPSPTISAE